MEEHKNWKKKELSVLLPVYECECTDLVKSLHLQLEELGLPYEVIVADDGSADKTHIEANRQIEKLSNVRYIVREENVGRSAIRNFLAQQARYEWLLFIDGDVLVDRTRFIIKYLERSGDVIVGGYDLYMRNRGLVHNLRFLYETATTGHRQAHMSNSAKKPHLYTSNFIIRRDIILEHPFNENITRYGYEDVLFGKTLCEAGHNIRFISNPVVLTSFEDNESFVKKTEEAMQTLHDFKTELDGYSAIPKLAFLRPVLKPLYGVFGKLIRRNLVGQNPHVSLLQLYRVLYYCSL